MTISRRQLLFASSCLALCSALPAQAARALTVPFSFDWLGREAQQMAATAYARPRRIESGWLKDLTYDQYRDIRFSPFKALWRGQRLPFRAEFFHPGALYLETVELNEVVDGQAQPIVYDPANFTFEHLNVPANAASEDSKVGYAGFRLHAPLNRPDFFDEFMVFLGASYFRGVGKGQAYGLSARGLAIDTGLAKGEEFPVFTRFWIERPARGQASMTVYALLDSESACGAYRFVLTPGRETVMEVNARLFFRKTVERLGIAPLTSMYSFGENGNRLNNDFRPEVHDSDGLLLNTGKGEWVWRPLQNPANLSISSFADENPKGFGLLQRDRTYDHYQDLEARYEDRPSLWVEPKGKWGKGFVQLVEIPTDSEIHDNIVAYWVPDKKPEPGDALDLSYRLSWGAGPASDQRPAEVVATHVGRQFDNGRIKFVIDYALAGGQTVKQAQPPAAEVWASAGGVGKAVVMANSHTGGWRVSFDLEPDGNRIHELRCLLRRAGRQVSETWSYQWRGSL